jgi:hypothetical protein
MSILFYLIFYNQKLPTMRKLLILSFIMYLGSSCTTPTEKPTEKTLSTDTAKPMYSYTIKKPDNWDMNGSSKNTEVAFNALKAFENHKIDESLTFFGDSVMWKADYMDAKLSKDSLKAIFNSIWNETASLKIDMKDSESVISKDKKDEYVTIWYVQTATDKKGKTDSLALINDMKIVNGKIVELDEYTRHFKLKK